MLRFEGDGMLHCVEFKRGTLTYANRYIQTEKYKNESAAGKALYPRLGSKASIYQNAKKKILSQLLFLL